MNSEWQFIIFVLIIIIGDTSGLNIYLPMTLTQTSNAQIFIGVFKKQNNPKHYNIFLYLKYFITFLSSFHHIVFRITPCFIPCAFSTLTGATHMKGQIFKGAQHLKASLNEPWKGFSHQWQKCGRPFFHTTFHPRYTKYPFMSEALLISFMVGTMD